MIFLGATLVIAGYLVGAVTTTLIWEHAMRRRRR